VNPEETSIRRGLCAHCQERSLKTGAVILRLIPASALKLTLPRDPAKSDYESRSVNFPVRVQNLGPRMRGCNPYGTGHVTNLDGRIRPVNHKSGRLRVRQEQTSLLIVDCHSEWDL